MESIHGSISSNSWQTYTLARHPIRPENLPIPPTDHDGERRRFTIGWPTLSHHVSLLEEVGLITISRYGRFKRCWITTEAIGHIGNFLLSLSPRVVPDPPKGVLEKKQKEFEKFLAKNPLPKARPKK